MNFASKLIENAVHQFSLLPGVGKKTALRYVLHLLQLTKEDVQEFGDSLSRLRNELKYCKKCHNISDKEICEICSNHNRDHSLICVVEDIRDVMAIENTQQFRGLYHVLGGNISPMDGIGPKDLNIDTLVYRCGQGEIKEVIMALSTTMEGDTTNYFIYKKIKELPVRITTLARGVSIGDNLESTDEVTLGRSLLNRVPFEQSIQKNSI